MRATETKRKVDFWVSRFRQHIRATGKEKDIDVDKKELNDVMCSCLIDVEKDGTSYETSPSALLCHHQHKHIEDNGLGNLETDPEFQTARDIKHAQLKLTTFTCGGRSLPAA